MSRKEALLSLPDIILAGKEMKDRIFRRLGYARTSWGFMSIRDNSDAEPLELLSLCVHAQDEDEEELFKLCDELLDYTAFSPSLLVRRHVTVTMRRDADKI